MVRPGRRRPSLRRLAALAVAAALAACGGPGAQAEGPRGPLVAASPLYQEGGPWSGPEAGLGLRSAQVLTEGTARFGGWSGLAVERGPAGSRLLAVSDRGYWLRAPFDESTGILGEAELGRLHGTDGAPLLDNDRRDAEELVLLPSGAAIVSFEREHRLWLYPPPATAAASPFTGKPIALPLPPDIGQGPRNRGMEAVALLPDGRLLVLVEGEDGTPTAQGWLGRPDRAWDDAATEGRPPRVDWRPFRLALSGPDFRPTAAAASGAWLYVVERAFSMPLGFRNRVRRLPLAAVEAPPADQPVTAETLAPLSSPPVADNFEALAALPGEGGTWLHLMTDDNYNGLQRTLLLILVAP